MSREKAGGSSISSRLGLTSFNNPLAQLIHKYKDVEKCDRIYRDIRSILSFTSQPELRRLQSLMSDQEEGKELEEVLHYVEQQKKELENKWVLQELKGKLQLIEAVERKVTDHQFSGTQV